MSIPVKGIVIALALAVGVPKAFQYGAAQTTCEATPEMVQKVMDDMLPADYTGDKDALKARLLRQLHGTGNCAAMVKKVQDIVLNPDIGDGKDVVTFKSDKEALEYFRKE